MKIRHPFATFCIFLSLLTPSFAKTVKVFILAGQSNMQGHGKIEANPNHNEGKGSLSHLAENNEKFKSLKDKSGNWIERKDVHISYLSSRHSSKGKLKPGFGANPGMIGPELGFGQVIGNSFDDPVLLIKTAWGGKSLAVDFRPPSSGGEVGPYYKQMLDHVKSTLENLNKEFPGLGKNYEICGFGWHQGWNDGCDMGMTQQYEENMKNFIKDIRTHFDSPNLPFVIADSGFGGSVEKSGRRFLIREAQANAAKAFSKTATCVETGEFFRPVDQSPSKQGYHWNSNAETYYLVGEAMGLAMQKLLGASKPKAKGPKRFEARLFRNVDGTKSFKARFVKFNGETQKVTVSKIGGRTITFKLTFLHPEDQEYVKSQAE